MVKEGSTGWGREVVEGMFQRDRVSSAKDDLGEFLDSYWSVYGWKGTACPLR